MSATDEQRERLNGLSKAIAALSMDEPPTDATLQTARTCLDAIGALKAAATNHTSPLLESMSAALSATIERHVLFVYTVPHLVAACELLASADERTAIARTALEGCRYELDTLTPVPGTVGGPDVPLSALSRGAKRDRRD